MNTKWLLPIACALGLMLPSCVVVSTRCEPGYSDCGEYCADLRNDPRDCGACGASCYAGDACVDGRCVAVCLDDGFQCRSDADCCSDYCASDGVCGCIPGGHYGCAAHYDCCTGYCGRDGFCY